MNVINIFKSFANVEMAFIATAVIIAILTTVGIFYSFWSVYDSDKEKVAKKFALLMFPVFILFMVLGSL